MTETKSTLEIMAVKQLILYAVQKQMFCPTTGIILDVRTCILVDVETADGKAVHSKAIAPACDIQQIKDRILKVNPALVVTFYSRNKTLKTNPLITII